MADADTELTPTVTQKALPVKPAPLQKLGMVAASNVPGAVPLTQIPIDTGSKVNVSTVVDDMNTTGAAPEQPAQVTPQPAATAMPQQPQPESWGLGMLRKAGELYNSVTQSQASKNADAEVQTRIDNYKKANDEYRRYYGIDMPPEIAAKLNTPK